MPDPGPRPTILRKLATLSRHVRTRFDARAGEFGLTQARALILLRLQETPSMSQAELAEEMGVEPPTMARLVDAMETGGLVRREVSPEDRRCRNVVLTDEAQGAVKALRALSETLRAEVLDGIPPDDLKIADRVIDQMLDNIGRTER